MIVYVNDNYEIKDVGSTTDESLTKVEIADDEYNPFRDWSVAKILCYKVLVKDNRVVMMTPYVDSRIIEHIDKLGIHSESNSADISNNSDGIFDLADVSSLNSDSIFELADLIENLNDRLTSLEKKED